MDHFPEIHIPTLLYYLSGQQMLLYIFVVFLMLSGFFFPIENMPPFLQYITYADPFRYFMTIIREIFIKGSTAAYLKEEIFAMAAFGIALITFSALRFQKRTK